MITLSIPFRLRHVLYFLLAVGAIAILLFKLVPTLVMYESLWGVAELGLGVLALANYSLARFVDTRLRFY